MKIVKSQHAQTSEAQGSKRLPRGRPKDDLKRDAILRAAQALFSREGMAGTSMDGIADAAGVSKATLYSHFSDKEELFQQAVMKKCAQYTPEEAFNADGTDPLVDRLLRIGHGFLDLVIEDEPMSLYRLMAADGARAGKLGLLFWEAGPERQLTMFARLLESANAAGELKVDKPRRAAAHFFCLLKGEIHLRCLVGAGSVADRKTRRAHVEDVVAMFLRAYAPGTRA